MNPNQQLDAVMALREAGHVSRGHTLRFVGHYDVAQHSWHMAVLLYQLHPDPSPALVKMVLLHDVGERFVGDLPGPIKWTNPKLADLHGELESQALAALGGDVKLTPEEYCWLKALDVLELFLWTQDQKAFGNEHVNACLNETIAWFRKNHDRIPEQVSLFYKNYIWFRHDNELPKSV